MRATHIHFKGTSIAKKVELLNFCHNPDYAMVVFKNSSKPVKVHVSTLTPIRKGNGSFLRKVSNYVIDSVVPVIIGILSRRIFKK